MKRIGWVILALLLIAGCSDTKKIAPKEGRIAVISENTIVQATGKVSTDKAVSCTEWTAPNANTRNKMPAVSLEKSVPQWTAKGAEGKEGLPLTTPVIVKDKIYTLDGKVNLIARNVKDGSEIWRTDLGTKLSGIGLTANKDFIVGLDENGTVATFDTEGKQLWKKEFNTPFRNAPLLVDNTIYLLSSGNDLWVLNAKNGNQRWHYKTTSPLTLLQGMARPAVASNILVVPFSTGEVVAFDASNGTLLWSQDLIGQKVFDAIASLSQISASPVIENGIVYLVGHSGQTLAVNLNTGESLWKLARGGRTTPFVSGNTLFFVDNQNHLLAVNKKNGKLFWETTLDENVWKGPYLVDNKLVLFTDTKVALVDPQKGDVTFIQKRIEGSTPALTNDGVFFLGDNGKLYHWEKI